MRCPLTLHICDDHELVRDGIRRVLEGELDLVVTNSSASADAELVALREAAPDVLLLDIAMAGRSGIDALPEILETAPSTKVLMLSMQDDPAYVRKAFACGAMGYVLKEAAGAELVDAIHEVAEGRRYLHPVLGARMATSLVPLRANDELSERELQVLRLLALGYTNQEIADNLIISVRTAETHRARMMQKLGLRTRAEIVRYALETGELDPGRTHPLPH